MTFKADEQPMQICSRCGLSKADVERERRIGGTFECWYRRVLYDHHIWVWD